MGQTLQEGSLSKQDDNDEDQGSGKEYGLPSATTCPQDNDVTLVHVKINVHENRIAFWPETGKVLHSNQRRHTCTF